MPRSQVFLLAVCLVAVVALAIFIFPGLVGNSCASSSSAQTTPAAARPPGQIKLTLPPRPKVLIFGDSYTEGYGADPKTNGYAYLVGAGLDWQVTVDGAGGSGYVATGPQHQGSYLSRLASAPSGPFDLVVLQGSSNDQQIAPSRLRPALEQMVAAVHARYPSAQLAMMGLVAIYGHPSGPRAATNAVLSQYALARQIAFLDPLAENWFTPGNSSSYVNTAVGHPNNAGYVKIAQMFVRDASAMTRTTADCS